MKPRRERKGEARRRVGRGPAAPERGRIVGVLLATAAALALAFGGLRLYAKLRAPAGPASATPSSAVTSAPATSAASPAPGPHGLPGAPPLPPAAVRALHLPDQSHWEKAGYVEMTPPIRLPTNVARTDRVAVWLRLPDGPSLTVERAPGAGELAPRLPAGAASDRIETRAVPSPGGASAHVPTILDVRGTVFGPGGEELFHVYRPVDATPRAALAGWEWRRGDAEAARAATDALGAFVATAPIPGVVGAPPRAGFVDLMRKFNDCTHCHATDKPAVALEKDAGDLPRRATDRSGLYVVLTVLRDDAPMDPLRAVDLNADDPYVTIRCGADAPALEDRTGRGLRWRCADGSVPRGRRDTARGVAAGDPYSAAVCRSRAYLWSHSAPEARAAFAAAYAACGLGI